MLHQADQNQHNTASKTIKLSSNFRTEPVGRSLKSSIINYKDSISQTKNNDIMQSSSTIVQHKDTIRENSNNKTSKLISHQKQLNNNRNKEMENKRQQLLATSPELKSINNQFNQSYTRFNQKSFYFSQNKQENKTPNLRKDQPQFTRASHNLLNDSMTQIQRINYQNQIQDLINKVQFLQNQCRNLKSQNQNLHRTLGASKQIMQRDIQNKIFLIDDLEKRLSNKNKQYLDKCLENQNNLARVTQFQGLMKKLDIEKQKINKQFLKIKQNGLSLSRLLNESRAATLKIQSQKKILSLELEDKKLKVTNLTQQKRQLELQLQKICKIKQLVKQLEQSDDDKAQTIKKHIAYEVQLIQSNSIILSNFEIHKHDLKVTSDHQQSINITIQSITQQIAVKLRDVLQQKQRLQEQLNQAKAETERIRKTMFVNYQEIIANLKDELIQLKQQNVNLANNSQLKIKIIKLERQVKILQNKNDYLVNRHKQLESIIQRLQNIEIKNTSELSTQTSLKVIQLYDRTGQTNLESIIQIYQNRSVDLNSRINQKEYNQQLLKKRVQQLESQVEQLKGKAQLTNRIQKSDTQNIKIKLQSMKMQLKSQTDSLNRKIDSLEKNIQRKNKQIKQKDNFITRFLIQRVKDENNVKQIVEEIDKFFAQQTY